jgi:hypothetical protein
MTCQVEPKHVSPSDQRKLEQGAVDPGFFTVKALALALGVTISAFEDIVSARDGGQSEPAPQPSADQGADQQGKPARGQRRKTKRRADYVLALRWLTGAGFLVAAVACIALVVLVQQRRVSIPSTGQYQAGRRRFLAMDTDQHEDAPCPAPVAAPCPANSGGCAASVRRRPGAEPEEPSQFGAALLRSSPTASAAAQPGLLCKITWMSTRSSHAPLP